MGLGLHSREEINSNSDSDSSSLKESEPGKNFTSRMVNDLPAGWCKPEKEFKIEILSMTMNSKWRKFIHKVHSRSSEYRSEFNLSNQTLPSPICRPQKLDKKAHPYSVVRGKLGASATRSNAQQYYLPVEYFWALEKKVSSLSRKLIWPEIHFSQAIQVIETLTVWHILNKISLVTR